MRFQNKVVIVTGAGSGIGRAIARKFAAEGAHVAGADIDGDKLKALADELTGEGKSFLAVQGNIANGDDVSRMIDGVKDKFGRVDILVNNAGIMDRFLPAGELTDEVWNRVLGVNLNGPMFTMRKVIPGMLEQGQGVIVNISSAAGLGGGFAGAAYTASKHGVIGLTKNTAVMYGKKGIRTVAVCPGGVDTGISLGGAPSDLGYAQLGPSLATMPRVGKPEEIANVVLFLASEDASFVNGAVVPVDGGWLAGG